MNTIERGYSITPASLTKTECRHVIDALSTEALIRSRAGARHLMSNPLVADLAHSELLTRLAKECLNGEAVPFRATLFDKSLSANWLVPWHQDTALPLARRFELDGWGPWSEKAGVTYAHAPAWALARVVALRLHLDDSGVNNGPLRVIPGSHMHGVLTDADVAQYASTHNEAMCLTECGGVIAMRPLLIHCSSKARNLEPRRVLHIEYAESLDLSGGIQLAVA